MNFTSQLPLGPSPAGRNLQGHPGQVGTLQYFAISAEGKGWEKWLKKLIKGKGFQGECALRSIFPLESLHFHTESLNLAFHPLHLKSKND